MARSKKSKVTDKLKHYLNSARYWSEKKDYLSTRIERLRSRAEKTTSAFQDVPAFSGSFDDYRQTVIADMIDTERKYKDAVAECKKKLQEIEFFIGCLEDYNERSALERHYVYMENWQDVALQLHYTERQIHNIHGDALMHLLDIHKKFIENGGKPLF